MLFKKKNLNGIFLGDKPAIIRQVKQNWGSGGDDVPILKIFPKPSFVRRHSMKLQSLRGKHCNKLSLFTNNCNMGKFLRDSQTIAQTNFLK